MKEPPFPVSAGNLQAFASPFPGCEGRQTGGFGAGSGRVDDAPPGPPSASRVAATAMSRGCGRATTAWLWSSDAEGGYFQIIIQFIRNMRRCQMEHRGKWPLEFRHSGPRKMARYGRTTRSFLTHYASALRRRLRQVMRDRDGGLKAPNTVA